MEDDWRKHNNFAMGSMKYRIPHSSMCWRAWCTGTHTNICTHRHPWRNVLCGSATHNINSPNEVAKGVSDSDFVSPIWFIICFQCCVCYSHHNGIDLFEWIGRAHTYPLYTHQHGKHTRWFSRHEFYMCHNSIVESCKEIFNVLVLHSSMSLLGI